MPTSGLSGATCISTVYSRGSVAVDKAAARSGNSQRAAKIRNVPPISAAGTPTQETSNMPKPPESGISVSSMPCTTRLVLVPINVQVPPRIAA